MSKDINEKFRQRVSSGMPLEIDFRVQVLTHGSWPLTQSISFTPPPEINKAIERFTNFYVGQHGGRRLTWQYNLSKGELVMQSEKKRYTIKANTYQMAILLQFNDGTELTPKQIIERTGIRQNYVLEMLHFLVKKFPKLLKNTEKSNVTEDSTIKLNTNYDE